jgi:hypothetical protein
MSSRELVNGRGRKTRADHFVRKPMTLVDDIAQALYELIGGSGAGRFQSLKAYVACPLAGKS